MLLFNCRNFCMWNCKIIRVTQAVYDNLIRIWAYILCSCILFYLITVIIYTVMLCGLDYALSSQWLKAYLINSTYAIISLFSLSCVNYIEYVVLHTLNWNKMQVGGSWQFQNNYSMVQDIPLLNFILLSWKSILIPSHIFWSLPNVFFSFKCPDQCL
jgi:hypothetical protein